MLLSSFFLAAIKHPRHIYTKIPVLSKAETLSLSSQQILNLKMTAAILPVSRENQHYLISLAILQCHLHNVEFRSSTVTCSHSFTTLMSIGSARWKCWNIPSSLFHISLGLNQLLNFPQFLQHCRSSQHLSSQCACLNCCIVFAVFSNDSLQIKCLYSIKENNKHF